MANAVDDDILKQFQETLASDPDNPSHHFNLGAFLWKIGEESDGEESKRYKERSAEHFWASAKLNPSDGPAFRFLGHYYSRDSLDVKRAAKCYQRAVNLNPQDFEAGVQSVWSLLDSWQVLSSYHVQSSLTKAQATSPVPSPIVSALLAQAEASRRETFVLNGFLGHQK